MNENVIQEDQGTVDFDHLQQLAIDMRNNLTKVAVDLEATKADLVRVRLEQLDCQKSRKRTMAIIQISALMIYLLILVMGFFYGLFEDFSTFKYVMFLSSWFMLLVFVNRLPKDDPAVEHSMDVNEVAIKSVKETIAGLENDYKL